MESVHQRTELIEDFFVQYANRFNAALTKKTKVSIKAVQSEFSEEFLQASPLGVKTSKNDQKFAQAISKDYEFYRKIGTKSMRIVTIRIVALDDFHSMAKVNWQALYEKKDRSELIADFEVIYLLQILKNKPKIFAFISGDEQKYMQENGLL